jgi:rSAM/selenodomain-associated transferase 2/rSAM/selenodomain-associated transferase 1
MQGRRSEMRDRVIIFGRYPIPGKTKTRLISAMGPAGAADLQRWLTEKTLESVRAFAFPKGIDVEFCFEGGSERKMRRWLGMDISFYPQAKGDLGERMSSAFFEAFRRGARRVVLLGTDIAELKACKLGQAFDALVENDLVIGPSADGGYWLIGLNRFAPLFEGIDWGTRAVIGQTRALANGQGLRVKELDVLTDIDTVKDLRQLPPERTSTNAYISIVIPALNEAANIETAIRNSRSEDAEIIVVDGGSTDDTIARAIQAGARVESSYRGRARQQNRGASCASGRVLLFLHADTRLPRGYANHVFEILMDPETVAGAFRFKTTLDGSLMKFIELMTNIRSQYFNLPYGDQGLFIRKSIFDSVKGFPEVPIAEDLSLVRRLLKMGRIRIAPVYAVTSGRRWQMLGLLRTTLINQVILTGFFLGVSPSALASLYHISREKNKK